MLGVAELRCSKCKKKRAGVFLLRDGSQVCWHCLHKGRRQRPYASPQQEQGETLARDVRAFDAIVAARALKPPGAA